MSETKLKDLLSLKVESEDLDYKVQLDLNEKKSVIELCIDIMSMTNALGGYLVFGVSDSAFEPVGVPENFHLDTSQIQQTISSFMKPVPTIFYGERSFKIECSEKRFAFIYIAQSQEIVITNKEANYTDKNGKTVNVFRCGEIFIRKGASSQRANSDSLRLLINRIAKNENSSLTQDNKLADEYSELQIRQFNNLQKPDYRKFIGREEYLEDIITKLNQRFFVISIDGIGGVGKTALALKVGHRCLQEKSFDAVIWVSAKKKRLILTGIDDIVPSLTGFENLVNTILEVLGFGTSIVQKLNEKIKMVNGLLSTAKCLIIVDNLETVEDERIFDFLKDLPEPSKALITSRKRLGEVERVVRLKEMSIEETKKLIEMDADDKAVEQLIHGQDQLFVDIHNVTGGIPLAIRWLVGWAALGHDVKTVCQKVQKSGSPVLDFCFKEVYEELLTPEERKILSIMPIFEHPPTKEEICAALPMDEEKLCDSLAQLVTLSLINQEIKLDEQGNTQTNYSALPLTLSFAQSKLSENRGLEASARERLAFFFQKQEKQKEAIAQYSYALEKVGATTEKGKLSALQAQLAFAAYQRGNYPEATKLFKQAVEANPHLAYTFNLWAMIERQEGNVGKAEELYREATRLNPNNPIAWRSWSMMKKEIGDFEGSAKILREGLKYKQSDLEMIHSLAVITSLCGRFGEADQLFQRAYVQIPKTFQDNRNNMYVFSARAENFRKWGEYEEDGKFFESAKDKYIKGLNEIAEGIRDNPNDWNLIRNRIRLYGSMARIESKLGNCEKAEVLYKAAIYYHPSDKNQRRHNSQVYFSRALNFYKMGKADDAITMCNESIAQEYNQKAERLRADIVRR
jgi:tetratricopeptide (TPR) repeat protein